MTSFDVKSTHPFHRVLVLLKVYIDFMYFRSVKSITNDIIVTMNAITSMSRIGKVGREILPYLR